MFAKRVLHQCSHYCAALLLAAMTPVVLAQPVEAVQRSSSPSGFKVQGDVQLNAQARGGAAQAVGTGNTARNATATVQGETQVRGKTRIDAQSQGANAIATGKDSKAENAVGAIGGK